MNSTYQLPAVNSAFPQSFTSKEEYLAFVRAWKHAYRYLSLCLRIARLESRRNDNNTPAKAKHLDAGIAAAAEAINALGVNDYVAAGIKRYHITFAFGAREATWMLQLRAHCKQVAARQREEAIAAKAGS